MLFPYTYVSNEMEKMQEFIDFIFYEIWCKAPIGLKFHPNLFDNNSDLKDIMTKFGFSSKPPKRGNQFYKDVEAIYDLFALLTPEEIDQFKKWYQSNNDIENICKNDLNIQLVRYKDLIAKYKDLGEKLEDFFKNLYSEALLGLADLRKKIGKIDQHYKNFAGINDEGKCPFCGISDMLGIYHTKREAYDHYLPKTLYPFNAINFRNLVPTCYHCNSSYKNQKDPAYKKNEQGQEVRRSIFYPYCQKEYNIEIYISLLSSDIEKLTPDDIIIDFGPDEIGEEIETWKDVYNIEETYKGKICGKNDGKSWLSLIYEGKNYGITPLDMLSMQRQVMDDQPYADCNFLRKPFLNACQSIGLFED